MLTTTKKLKVLVYGNVFRDYRSQLLVKFLLDSKYHISLVCPDFYVKERLKQSFTVEKFFIIFYLIEFFFKAAFADVIYLPPMNNRFIKSALWASKAFNKKLVVEMYTSLYDTFVRDRKLIKPESKKAKLVLRKDILSLTKSDYIIHTSNHELTYWEKIMGISIDPSKVFIAPICNIFPLASKKKFLQNDVLRICWWGTFIPLHGLDNILQAMKILKQTQAKVTCNLFGVNNEFFDSYLEKIHLYQINDFVILRKDLNFSNGLLPNYLVDNCDLALGIFGDTDKADNVVPNKLIEALSMGLPTLTMNSPALKEFFNPETDFWACEPSPESIAESILTIADGTAHAVDWEQTRQKVLSKFSVAQYQEVVNKVLRKVTDDLLTTKKLDIESKIFANHHAPLNQVEQ